MIKTARELVQLCTGANKRFDAVLYQRRGTRTQYVVVQCPHCGAMEPTDVTREEWLAEPDRPATDQEISDMMGEAP